MGKFRPKFYNDNPILHSIEILAWAAGRPAFILRQVLEQFGAEFAQYGDASHEASERIGKLVKSEMVAAVTPVAIGTWTNIIQQWEARDFRTMTEEEKEKGPWTTREVLKILEKMLVDIAESKGAGRKPRLYRVTQAGAKYVESRRADLEQIQSQKEKNQGSGA